MKAWREDQEQTLRALKAQGMTIAEMARYFPGKTPVAVNHRLRKLGLVERRPRPPCQLASGIEKKTRYGEIDRLFCKHFEKVSHRRYDGRAL